MIRSLFPICAALFAAAVQAAPNVHVVGVGKSRTVVSIETAPEAPSAKAFNDCLRRNLNLTGHFQVGPNGQIKISGTPGAGVTAVGNGKQLTFRGTFADDKGARMAARQFSDALVQAYTGQKGFAQERIAFAQRKGKDDGELYMCYPDGFDIRQLTADRHAVVGPRWAPNKNEILYTGFLQKTPLVYRIGTNGGRPQLLAQFKGLATGAAMAENGHTCAIILSFQGNPELYVVDFSSKQVNRMTRTVNASEASPCWSPDGRKIAYVSDSTRQPQIYLLDVASKRSTRLTNQGSQNTNPDWGPNGLLVYASKRGGQNVLVVMDPKKGEGSARVVTAPGSWEHPSWAVDGRHVVAERDKALFIVDTDPEGDKPVQLFRNAGHWMNPAWCR